MKTREDAKLGALSEEQQEQIEGWLFEENLGYRTVAERVEKEWGISVSPTAVRRFYGRLARERMEAEWLELEESRKSIGAKELPMGEVQKALVKLTGKRLIELATEAPERVMDLQRLSRVILGAGRQELQRDRLAIEKERLEMEIETWTLKIQELEKERESQAEWERRFGNLEGLLTNARASAMRKWEKEKEGDPK